MDSNESDKHFTKIEELEDKLAHIKTNLKLKDELLVNIVRELRSSLSLIQGPANNLKRSTADSEQKKHRQINVIHKNVERLHQIIVSDVDALTEGNKKQARRHFALRCGI